MDPQAERPARHPTRLKEFDYTTNNGYVVTICAHNRQSLFGSVRDGNVCLSPLGSIVEAEWWRTAEIRTDVVLDAFMVMPNHLHGIIILNLRQAPPPVRLAADGLPPAPVRGLGAIVRGFKSAVTAQARRCHPPMDEPIWQRNFHDHIIRNDAELERYREYIRNNAKQWELDRYHEE
jgi:putative transposase